MACTEEETALTKLPPMKWSQTADTVSIVFRILHDKDTTLAPTVVFGEERLSFEVDANGTKYKIDARTFARISESESKWSLLPNGAVMVVLQKVHESEDEYVMWPFPFHDIQQYKSFVQVDWDRWEDSDEDDESDADQGAPPALSSETPDMASLMGSLGGMGGGGGDMQKMMEMLGGENGAGPDFSKLAEGMSDVDMESMMQSMAQMGGSDGEDDESDEEGDEEGDGNSDGEAKEDGDGGTEGNEEVKTDA